MNNPSLTDVQRELVIDQLEARIADNERKIAENLAAMEKLLAELDQMP